MAAKSSVESRESRYVQGGDTYVYTNRLGWWERDLTTFEPDATDLFVTIAPEFDKRPDKLAFQMYGRASLQWLVLQYNSIVDVNEEFITGKRIRLPDPSRASYAFLNKRTGGIPVK